jgi:hypothetical protein
MKRKKQRKRKERKKKRKFDARDHKEGCLVARKAHVNGTYGFAKCHPNLPVIVGLYCCAYV